MVRTLIYNLGNDQQRKKWLPFLDTSKIIGAYAQTELGHGSDVQSLETTATYRRQDRCFVINTPSIKAYKWWPGELGHLSNIAIVFCSLILDEQKIGVFPFVVQIRDFKTHEVLPGVEVGDIGPKLS